MEKVECEKCGLMFNVKGIAYHKTRCRLTKEDVKTIIFKYEEGDSTKKLKKEYNISSRIIEKILLNKTRNFSEAGKLSHKKYPESFKHSDESKQKMREIRLKFMEENPDKTAWRQKNMSYPESVFYNKLFEVGYDKKYYIEREYCVFPYFIDFAFVDEKIAVEIDGSQHLQPEVKEKDERKDLKLIENGWFIYRITANQVQMNINLVFEELEEILNNNKHKTPQMFRCGVIKHKSMQEIRKEKRVNKFLNLLIDQNIIEVENINEETLRKCDEHLKTNKINGRQSSLAVIDIKELLNDVYNNGFNWVANKHNCPTKRIKKYILKYRKDYVGDDIELKELLVKTFNFRKKEKRTCPNCGLTFYCADQNYNYGKYCSTKCSLEQARKNIPSKDLLLEKFHEFKDIDIVAEYYDITNGGVRRWCKMYDINYLDFK